MSSIYSFYFGKSVFPIMCIIIWDEMGYNIYILNERRKCMANTIEDMINDIVADKTGYDAAHKIAEAAVPPLSDMLSLSAVSAIATRATEEVGMKIARITSHQLALTLGKSIPNAAIPAIVHTITHSPLQDYFCYYCYTHKTYCLYCNYAPSQLYYAQYYANFYSSYYPLYYADYFGAQSATKRKK